MKNAPAILLVKILSDAVLDNAYAQLQRSHISATGLRKERTATRAILRALLGRMPHKGEIDAAVRWDW